MNKEKFLNKNTLIFVDSKFNEKNFAKSFFGMPTNFMSNKLNIKIISYDFFILN